MTGVQTCALPIFSWLTELPGGRKPIRTVVVNEADAATMGRMFAHIRARVDAGERAYIVCPRIDADDEENEGGSGVLAAAGSARGRAAASGSSARTAAGGRVTRAAADAIGIDDPYETFDENGETVARPPLHAVAEIADRLQKLPQFQGIRFATLTGRARYHQHPYRGHPRPRPVDSRTVHRLGESRNRLPRGPNRSAVDYRHGR